ncbi:MAG TPA: helix-turn-helix domain-containing protein [Candidatus Dormibacteraeota bacterium]|nr:helix-turn-helix domain-containing protein [Candidatus Dormibacteraeota bacterium]
MNTAERVDPRAHRALAGWSRVALLTELRRVGEPLSARDLAAHTGLHVNTVRFHLEVLAQAGLVRAEQDQQARRGRPRQLWAATPPEPDRDEDGYRVLAELLAGYLRSSVPEPALAALAAGDRFGAGLVSGPPALAALSETEAVDQVTTMLAELGFAPQAVRVGGAWQVQLRHCPFIDVAAGNTTVVCSAHLGLLRGALREMGAPLTATRLDALVTPTLCVAHLSGAPAPGTAG